MKSKTINFRARVFGVIAGIFAYYVYIWKDLAGFVRAMDHTDLLFGDFVLYYLPQAAEMLKQTPEAVYGYFYAAFFAFLLFPLNYLSIQSSLWVWGILQVFFLILLVVVRGIKRLGYYDGLLYLFLCLTSLPVLNNFKWGQISVLLTVCVLGAFYLYRSGHFAWAGVLIAFSAAIKYYTGIFALVFLFKLDRRALIAFALAFFAFFVLIPSSILGPQEWFRFQKQTFDNIALADSKWMPDDVNSQYMLSVGIRNIYEPSEPVSPRLTAILKFGGFAVAALNILAVWILKKSNDYELQISLLFTTIPFFLQTSWLHYFVFLPFVQAMLVTLYVKSQGKTRWLMAFPVLSAMISSIFLYNCIADWRVYSSAGWIFFANALLLPPLYWQCAAVLKTDRRVLSS